MIDIVWGLVVLGVAGFGLLAWKLYLDYKGKNNGYPQ